MKMNAFISKRSVRDDSCAPGAFTLIEVMIVVAILGLVLTMGIPSIVRTFEKEGMRKAQEDVLEACKAARAEAIIKASPQDLVFHPHDHTFEAPGFAQVKLPDNVAIEILGVNFIQLEDADIAKVKFYPNGTSDEFTIVLHSNQGEVRKISLDIVTALPELESVR